MTLRRVVVFAGESEIASADELAAARRVGQGLAAAGVTMVCSGEVIGPIGVAIDAAVRGGGQVVGIARDDRAERGVHPALSESRRTQDQGQQRTELAAAADAYIALPGAFATLDEVLALLDPGDGRETPLGLVDEGNAYTALLGRADDATLDRFVHQSQRGLIVMTTDLEDLLSRLRDYQPPETRRLTGLA